MHKFSEREHANTRIDLGSTLTLGYESVLVGQPICPRSRTPVVEAKEGTSRMTLVPWSQLFPILIRSLAVSAEIDSHRRQLKIVPESSKIVWCNSGDETSEIASGGQSWGRTVSILRKEMQSAHTSPTIVQQCRQRMFRLEDLTAACCQQPDVEQAGRKADSYFATLRWSH